ncbi:MAG: hypothetical protein RL701_7152 [Pseudomonadota bacterium]
MWTTLTKRKSLALGLCGVAAISGILIATLRSRVDATPPTLVQVPLPTPVPVVSPEGGVATPTAATPTPAEDPNMRITFSTYPPANATVTWGRKVLGRIAPKKPLVIVRPRDSGPLDVMVNAAGFIPVQTRAHTFADTNIQVKLTAPDQKQTLFGYRAPLDAGVPLMPDATNLPPNELNSAPPL